MYTSNIFQFYLSIISIKLGKKGKEMKIWKKLFGRMVKGFHPQISLPLYLSHFLSLPGEHNYYKYKSVPFPSSKPERYKNGPHNMLEHSKIFKIRQLWNYKDEQRKRTKHIKRLQFKRNEPIQEANQIVLNFSWFTTILRRKSCGKCWREYYICVFIFVKH